MIDRANKEHDLGDLLTSHGATLVATRGAVRYYDGLQGDVHDHDTTYIVSPTSNSCGHIGHSYSPNGKLGNVDFPHGFRWFDAFAALEHGGDIITALKALSPRPPRMARPLPPDPSEMPEYLTIEDAERRCHWREEKQQQRDRERRQSQQLIRDYSHLVADDTRLGERERAAWAGHCAFFASGGRHCVSVAAQATRLCNVEQADEAHVRRMQRANERLIACGYLFRTDRRDGTNRQTSWWEPCPAEHHRVTTEEGSGGAVTLQDHRVTTLSIPRACELGGGCHEDECEPTTEGASFDPLAVTAPSGEYTGRAKYLLTLDELWDASTDFWQAQRAQTPIIKESEAPPLPELSAQPRQRKQAEVTSLDRYNAKLALMSETQLAGELKKHRHNLHKHQGKSWLAEIKRRVQAVEVEIDRRTVPIMREAAPLSQALPSLYQQPLLALAPP